jgi:hypothetical protein
MDFRDFIEQDGKPWKANKEDILSLWNSLKPMLPVNPLPISKLHTGTRYDNDGIRITGSANFINSVLSRLKDLMALDHRPGVELDVEYRQIETKLGTPQDRQVFVCYIHLVEKKPEPVKPKKMATMAQRKTL